ncbi:MAG: hypothetical protein WKG07_00795 [Hymenobacter sp.]
MRGGAGPGANPTPSPDPAAEKARRLALATADWQQLLQRLHLTLPTLPPRNHRPPPAGRHGATAGLPQLV